MSTPPTRPVRTPVRRAAAVRTLAALAGSALVLAGTACAHVSPEDLDGRLNQLRAEVSEEIDAGDRATREALDGRMTDLESRVDGLRADLQALEEEFEMTVREFETALRFDVPVYFGFDEAEVRPGDREALDRFASVVRTYYPQAHVTVEGFTDPSGSAAYNQRLGMRRAEAVRAHLAERGLAGERLRAVSYGEDTARLVAPDASGPGTAGWQNRRVVLVIDHDGSLSPSALVSEDTETR